MAQTVRYSPGDGNVVAGNVLGAALHGSGTNWLVLFSGAAADPPPAQTISYQIPQQETIHLICGLTPNTPYSIGASITAGQSTIQIVPGGTWISSRSGVLRFKNGADGQLMAEPETERARLALRPRLFSSSLGLVLSGDPRKQYVIQTSTNLVDWTPLGTNQPFDGSWFFSDPRVAESPAKFYRAMAVP